MQLAPVLDRIRILPKKDANLDKNLGDIGEIFYDEQLNTLRIYSGKHLGGFPLLTGNNLKKELSLTGVATVDYTVTVGPAPQQQPGNKFFINGTFQHLNLVVGYTYIFDQTDVSNNNHPFNFSSDDQDGEQGAGTSYTDNVIYFLDDDPVTQVEYISNFQKHTIRKVQITITSATPTTLYYWCYNHAGMGGTIAINNPGTGSGAGGASVDVNELPPENAEEGNIWFNKNNGKLYVYVADVDSSQWVQPSVYNINDGVKLDVSNTAPVNPREGNIWFNTDNANLYVWVDDLDSSQWVQPAVPVVTPNTFTNISFNDSTQFSASGSDTLTFIDGPGIEITSDPDNKALIISSTERANTFSNISFNDSTQFSASGSDTLTFIDGPGIEITSDPDNKALIISSTGQPNAFNSINFNDSTQFSASGSDTLTFIDGPGIEIISDPDNKAIQINALPSSIQTANWTVYEDDAGNLIFTNGGTSVIKIEPSGAITSVNELTAFGTI